MPNTIDTSFIKEYDADLYIAFQQMGSKFRDRCRVKSGVRGSTVDFQKYGKGTASSKTRNGDITPMNPLHTIATCSISDWYAGEYIDKFDTLKQNIDEKKAVISTAAGALGRKLDSLVITAGYTSTNVVNQSANDLDLDVLLAAIENQLGLDAFEQEGMISMALGTKQWLKFLSIPEVKNSDFNKNSGELANKRVGQSRMFMGIDFFHTNLLTTTAGVTDCLLFDKRALGWAEAEGISTDVDWVGVKAAHFVNSMMSGGAVLIDADGVAKVKIKDVA